MTPADLAAFRKALDSAPLLDRLRATLAIVGDLTLYGRRDKLPEALRLPLSDARDSMRVAVMTEEERR